MAEGNHRHRAGSLRQVNKRNKRSNASKRSKARSAGGKVEGGSASHRASLKVWSSHSKADRAHMAKQRRDASRKRALEQRRGLSSSSSSSSSSYNSKTKNPPRVVGIVSLSEKEAELEEAVRRCLVHGANRVVVPASGEVDSSASIVTAEFDVHKRDCGSLTLLTSTSAFSSRKKEEEEKEDTAVDEGEDEDPEDEDDPDEVERKRLAAEDLSIEAALDMCRVCDMVVLLLDGEEVAEEGGTLAPPLEVSTDGRSTTVAGRTAITNRTTGTARYDYLISSRGDRVLTALKAQGLPTPVALLVHPEGAAVTTNGNATTTTIATPKLATGNDDDDDTFNVDLQDVDDAMSLGASTVKSLKSMRRSASRRRMEMRRYISRFATTEFGTDSARTAELHLASSSQAEAPTRTALLRLLCTTSASPPRWVAEMPRPYLLSEGGSGDAFGYRYDSQTNQLSLSGYVRGSAPWHVHSLIHLPNLGTFAVKNMCQAVTPSERAKWRARAAANNGNQPNADADTSVLFSDPSKREPLDMFATPDALMGEQNLVGFDQDRQANDEDHDEDDGKSEARPAGWSDYQSAWLDALPKEELDPDEVDYGELARELNQKKPKNVNDDLTQALDMDDANDISARERAALLAQRCKDQKDETEFPDEVQVPEDVPARDRFARYRSLKSFRRSFWDPQENLPETYATLYHFASFRATQRDVLADAKDVVRAAAKVGGHWEWGGTGGAQLKANGQDKNGDDDDDDDDQMEEDVSDAEEEKQDDTTVELLDGYVPVGTFVTLTVEGVSSEQLKNYHFKFGSASLMVGVSLLAHENKVSVMHAGLSQTSKCDDAGGPVKSKDVLTFRVGWRCWRARPVFSQCNLNCDKHKLERFLPSGGAYFAASVFGPVTYSPCPVLVFREASGGTSSQGGCAHMRELLAIGNVLGANANRIVVKRIVLTGYPVKVQKRNATVKYMFYNPDDVRWFKPAGLTTKHGLQGTIEQSVGEHGTMKCLFNAPIQQHDTVCLPLYKRIYPKYPPPETEGQTAALVVW